MSWADFFKLFTYSFELDPLSKKVKQQQATGAGISQPGAVPNIRGDGSFWGGSKGLVQLRDSNDFIDLSTVTNRQSRYKEYERLRNVSEIEQAMTVFADESCICGNTKIATPFYGYKTIRWLELYKKNEPFLVYCWDFEKDDYTLGWAYDPRIVKTAKTLKILLDNGTSFIVTPDHRILTRNKQWVNAEHLCEGDELMPFYHIRAQQHLTEIKTNQFPRIFTFKEGWKHERQFIDEWRTGRTDKRYERVNRACRLIAQGATILEVAKIMGHEWKLINQWIKNEGFSRKEIKRLSTKRDRLRVIGIVEWEEMEVYDLSVKKHENFCTDTVVMHNCQRNDEGHVFKIDVDSEEVKKELEFLFFHRGMLNMNREIWQYAKKLFIFGDLFLELVISPENPKDGVIKLAQLPPDSMYRIETTKGKLIEFQQGKEGPDFQALTRTEVTRANEAEIQQATAIRFTPHQIVHFRIGDDRQTFYPYGQSLIEPARGPAHQLRLMEDAMVVYRLSRAPERRVFYIDVGQIASFRAEAFIERMKDQFRKKKVTTNRGVGANAVEERWHAPAADEDYWLPIRPNSNTRIETLPGACLSLDAKIPLLDGSHDTLRRIIERWNNGEKMWAYSCNPLTGAIVPGKITWAGITRKNTEVVKVTFDNGESVICTPDHKFPLIGRGMIQAKDLQCGDSLIPFNVRMQKIRDHHKNFYRQIYDPAEKKWKFEHRMVGEFLKDLGSQQEKTFCENLKDEKKDAIHHLDLNRLNNNPENLAWMNGKDHFKLHEWIASEYAAVGGRVRAAQLANWKEKNDPGYEEFVEYSKQQFKSWRKSLTKNQRKELNKKVSESIKNFWKELSQEEKEIWNTSLKERGLTGNKVLRNLLKDPCFKVWFGNRIRKGFGQIRGTTIYKEKSKKIFESNKQSWANEEYKQTIVYPKNILDLAHTLAKEGLRKNEVADAITLNEQLMLEWKSANAHIKRKISFSKFTIDHLDKMIKQYGYRNWTQFKSELSLYNHKVVSVEFLKEKKDTGTITIDGNEELHGYHTFALECGVFTKNSNLGEIDDALYFRNKLLTALGLPKNFFANDDPQATRITLSAQDVRFARMIERLQQHIEDGLLQIAERHLELRGYPESAYDNLKIKMTPPSDWKELSRAEVVTNRINNANSLKGSLLLSDYDILTRWMQYTEDESQEMIARMKIQKLEDLKLQVMAQNPQLMGIGVPGDGETELGAEAGGPNPMLGPEGSQPSGPEGQPPMSSGPEGTPPPDQAGMATPGPATQQPPPSGGTLPIPEPEYIKKYDLEIEDYASQVDEEEIDHSEFD